MTKNDFLIALHDRLRGLPQDDIHAFLDNYSEIIDDRMEEGLTEAEAVAALGSVDDIAARILSETPHAPPAPAAPRKRSIEAWQIILLVISSPIWGALLIGASAVIFSLLCALWSIVIALFSVAVAVTASALGCLVAGIILLCVGHSAPGALCLGIGLICAGLTILCFLAFAAIAKGVIAACKALFRFIRSLFRKKEVTA